MSNSRPEHGKNSSDNVFDDISVGKDEACVIVEYIDSSDLSANSQRAVVNDLRKFARWFVNANREPLTFARVTTRDVTDFRDSLRRDQQQAVATVNRALVSVRRLFRWLCELGHLEPHQFPMTQREVIRGGKRCGIYFCVHGPRSVKVTAIWETDRNTILFYGSTGERYQKTRLVAAPRVELAAT